MPELRVVVWVNSARHSETPIDWLRSGARAAASRQLGGCNESLSSTDYRQLYMVLESEIWSAKYAIRGYLTAFAVLYTTK